jgi:D-amino-acid dehydrogenase
VRVLRRFGYRFPMVRKRGYHRHFRGRPIDLPLRDAKFGYMICPMAAGMRITTGAELSGVEAEPTPLQLGRAEASARRLLDLGAPVENQPWLGTRPCMPDMLPVVGAARRHKGMWLHFGHGHQGFTLGPATGRLLAEMMTGGGTYIDPVPFRPERYRGGR